MNVLVATSESLDDVHKAALAAEGELVMFSSASFGNRCQSGENNHHIRKMVGMETHNEIIIMKVVDTDITEDLFVEHLLISLAHAGFLDYSSTDDMARRAMEDMKELLKIAAMFPPGTILKVLVARTGCP